MVSKELLKFFSLEELGALVGTETAGDAKDLKNVCFDKFDGLLGVDGASTRDGEPKTGVGIQDGEESIHAIMPRKSDDKVEAPKLSFSCGKGGAARMQFSLVRRPEIVAEVAGAGEFSGVFIKRGGVEVI